MRKIVFWLAVLASSLLPVLYAAPAHAQATRTWVSGVGDDANPCSRTAPCKTFAGAISKTAAGGEIDNLDTGGFGALTITKSITIDGGGGAVASVLVSGTPGMTIAAGATDVVILRNLRFQGLLGNGGSPSSAGTIGVNITSAATVDLENVTIMGFSQDGVSDTRAGGGTRLFIKDTTIENVSGPGVNAAAAATNSVVLENVRSVGNAVGVMAATGNVVFVNSSVITGNTTAGVEAATGAEVFVDRTVIANNGIGTEPGGTIVLGNSDIGFNTTGISAATASFGNNRLYFNAANGVTPTLDGKVSSEHGQE
jgi:hypothetical protein